MDELLHDIADLIYTDATDVDGGHLDISYEQALADARDVWQSLLSQKDYPRQHEVHGIRFILSEAGLIHDSALITASVWQGRSWMPVGEFEVPSGLVDHLEG